MRKLLNATPSRNPEGFRLPEFRRKSGRFTAPGLAGTLGLLAALATGHAPAWAAAPAAPFPKAQAGETRWRIQLPAEVDEGQLKVELIPGKTARVDCNVHRLMGEFEEETVQGWGHTYYRLKSKGEMLGTLMACPGQPEKEAFVTGTPLLLPYNSRLPLMVYAPDGIEIRYRVLRGGSFRKATRD